ncbi:MAG: mechanosensitive ion channel family protein [Ruegeria sp.]
MTQRLNTLQFRLLATLTLAFQLLWNAPVTAQDTGSNSDFDYSGASVVLNNASEKIQAEATTTDALRLLRSRLVILRDQASDIVNSEQLEYRRIKAKLGALDPAPAAGESEADIISQRRQELNEQLALVDEPIREARDVLAQVELLIWELDRQLRIRQLDALFTRTVSVVEPGAIQTAIVELSRDDSQFSSDFFSVAKSVEQGRPYGAVRLFLALLFAAGGLAILFRAQPRISDLLNARTENTSGIDKSFWVAIATVSNFAIPLLGALSLALIPISLGLRLRSEIFAGEFFSYVLFLTICGYWMGQTIFAPGAPGRRLVNVTNQEASLAVRLCLSLGALSAMSFTLHVVDDETPLRDETISVLATPVTLVTALLLWLLANLLRPDESQHGHLEDNTEGSFGNQVGSQRYSNLLRLLLRATAIASVLSILTGYVNMAQHVATATVLTIALFGLSLLLFTFVNALIRFIAERVMGQPEPSMPLVSLIVGATVTFLSLPFVALAWGVQVADLQEAWRLIVNGIELNGIRISLNVVASFLAVLFVGVFVTRWVQFSLRVNVLPRTRLDFGSRNALVTGVGYFGITLAGILALSSAGVSMSSIAVIAGALSLGIGFGLQTIVSNFISGIILLFERPIAVGDWIEVSGHSGTVKKISVRSTQLETFDRHEVIIPNQDLIANTVKNLTLSSRVGRLIIPVGVAFNSDLEQTKSILEAAAAGHPEVLEYPAPSALFRGIGESSLDFELRCYLKNVDSILVVQSDLLFRIFADLNAAGIEIPFPRRDVHLTDAAVEKET